MSVCCWEALAGFQTPRARRHFSYCLIPGCIHPRVAQRVGSEKSNGRESVLHGSHMCLGHRAAFLMPNRGKAELIRWGTRSAVCLPDAFLRRWGRRVGPGLMTLFMTLS